MIDLPKRIEGIELKVERAKAHVRDLGNAIKRFLKTNPYEVVSTEDDPEPGDCTYHLRVRSEPPPVLGAMFGDAIHNLRSALDNLTVLIVEHHGGSVGEGTRYPIPKKPPRTTQEFEAYVSEKVKGARQEVIDQLVSSEPYDGGNGHQLWVLHRLNVLDKHYLVVPTWASYQRFLLNTPPTLALPGGGTVPIPGIAITPKERCPMKDGDPLLTISAGARRKDDQEPGFSIEVAIHQPSIVECEPVLPLLNRLGQATDDAIRGLVPLL